MGNRGSNVLNALVWIKFSKQIKGLLPFGVGLVGQLDTRLYPPEQVRTDGAISAGREIIANVAHARAIATAGDPVALAEKIIADGLSVRGAEALARKEQAPERKARAGRMEKAQKDADTRSLEADLAERLGLDVEISHRGEAGEIRVRYSTLEQLDDLCRRLSSR